MIFSFLTPTEINLALIFVVCFASSLGMPGGDIWLVSSGALADKFTSIFPIIIVGFFAAILGDLTAYFLASRFSPVIYSILRKHPVFKRNEASVKVRLEKSEFFLVFISRFLLTGLGAIVSYISGFTRLNKKKFIVAAIIGDILYASLYTMLGFFFKEVWTDLTSLINEILFVIIILVLIYFIVKYLRYVKSKKNSDALNYIKFKQKLARQ